MGRSRCTGRALGPASKRNAATRGAMLGTLMTWFLRRWKGAGEPAPFLFTSGSTRAACARSARSLQGSSGQRVLEVGLPGDADAGVHVGPGRADPEPATRVL